MAKKKSKQQQQQQEDPVEAIPVEHIEETEDDDDDESIELLQVDLGDIVKMKQILDETVITTIAENVKEDFHWDNVKLVIMTSACLFACIAQFAPLPFPDSRPVLGICCCLYFILSGVLQMCVTFIDQDCILLTQPKKVGTKNKNLEKYGIRVRAKMPKYSEFYTLILQFQNMENSPCVQQTWSIGNFFDIDGMFDEVALVEAVQGAYDRLEKGKYDDTKKEKTN
mmetsp:Transcript_3900/g.5757  ORF Transcript_3900/g.5757 Transcript_3900/m.5757 type:complete len:225 (+) Transcript_3900:37-711(+)